MLSDGTQCAEHRQQPCGRQITTSIEFEHSYSRARTQRRRQRSGCSGAGGVGRAGRPAALAMRVRHDACMTHGSDQDYRGTSSHMAARTLWCSSQDKKTWLPGAPPGTARLDWDASLPHSGSQECVGRRVASCLAACMVGSRAKQVRSAVRKPRPTVLLLLATAATKTMACMCFLDRAGGTETAMLHRPSCRYRGG